MTLRALEIFLRVVTIGGMRAAADSLYISQPSVSGAVAELEREYDTLLFDRLGRRLYLTPAGEKLAGYARRLLGIATEMNAEMHSLSAASELRLGATVTVGSCVLCDILDQLEGPPPHVVVDNTERIEELVLKSTLDAALAEGRAKSPELICTPVIFDQLVLTCATKHPFAKLEQVPVAMLADQPFIVREPGSATRALLETAMATADVPFHTMWECNNSEGILRAVETGRGLSVMSARLAAPAVRAKRIAALHVSGCALGRWFSVMYHKDKNINAALAQFLALCAEYDPQATNISSIEYQ